MHRSSKCSKVEIDEITFQTVLKRTPRYNTDNSDEFEAQLSKQFGPEKFI